MATGTIILRPSGDISFGHQPNKKKKKGFALISESTADGDSTYIYQEVNDKSNPITASSSFKLNGNIPTSKIKITNIKVIISYGVPQIEVGNIVSGEIHSTISYDNIQGTDGVKIVLSKSDPGGYQTINGNISNLLQQINTDISNNVNILSKLSLQITSSGKCAQDGTSYNKPAKPFNIRITQAYVELTYETITEPSSHFFIKENNVFVEYSAAYKKENGKWTKQDFETALSGLTNGSKTNFVKNKK